MSLACLCRRAFSTTSTLLRTPSIAFLGKSRWEHHDDAPKPHASVRRPPLAAGPTSLCSAQAPESILKSFDAFQEKQRNPPAPKSKPAPSKAAPSASKGLPAVDFEEWWEMPARFRRRLPWEEADIELIQVSPAGGAMALSANFFACSLVGQQERD
jgi:hypothetical protein